MEPVITISSTQEYKTWRDDSALYKYVKYSLAKTTAKLPE